MPEPTNTSESAPFAWLVTWLMRGVWHLESQSYRERVLERLNEVVERRLGRFTAGRSA